MWPTIPIYNSAQFGFDMEITFWSMDCMKSSIILWKKKAVDVAMDAAKIVSLMWLNARIGTVNYPAYACHTHTVKKKKAGERIYART